MPTPATAKKMPMPPSDPMLGQREKNKIDKLRRIKDAAQELFLSKGFDDTTTREIALRAGRRHGHCVHLCRQQARPGISGRQ